MESKVMEIDKPGPDMILACDECLANRSGPWKGLEETELGCSCPTCGKQWLWRKPDGK